MESTYSEVMPFYDENEQQNGINFEEAIPIGSDFEADVLLIQIGQLEVEKQRIDDLFKKETDHIKCWRDKEITKLDKKRKYDDAAEILDNYASLISNLNLDNEQLNNEVTDLRSRAQNMRQFKDDFYTVREKKRMFYESDKMAKSEMISYQKMKGRRKD
jgi:hypothetical protein